MSRSGVFYFIEAMDGASARGRNGGRALDAQARVAARPGGSTRSLVRRVLAVLHR